MEDIKTRGEAQALFQDLDKPSLHALSYALRHPDTWPKGFVWDYSKCDQCAMGLAHALWGEIIPDAHRYDGATIMAREFAIPYSAAESIFLAKGYNAWCPTSVVTSGRLWWKREKYRTDLKAVTPEMVADQIDLYLETAE